MDNIKYYNDCLAYDFNMFMPRPAVREEKNNIVKLPKAQVKRKAVRKAATRTMSVTAFAVFRLLLTIILTKKLRI